MKYTLYAFLLSLMLASHPALSAAEVNDAAELQPQSEADYQPPELYKIGIGFKEEGKYEDAAAYLYAAARRGYHLAEVELAFLHTEQDSPLRDDPVGYAWFTLALKHETDPKLQSVLKSNLLKVRARMNDAEKTRAKHLRITLDKNLGGATLTE